MNFVESREMISSRTSEQISDDPAEQTDRALLARIADGDRHALRDFFLRHEMHVYKLLRPLSDMRESVEEAALDTFVAVWREARGFRGESRALIWLLGIAYRRGLAYQRGESARSNGTAAPAFGDDPPANTTRPEWLSRALLQLPFKQRAVIELAYGIGLSCEEMAAVMQCAPKMVKTSLLRARLAFNLASAKMARK